MRQVQKRLYREIIHLLRTDPTGWKFSKHTANYETHGGHGFEIEIWCSNRFYATRWTYGMIHSENSEVDIFWFLKPWQWWRVKLIREVEKAQYAAMLQIGLEVK